MDEKSWIALTAHMEGQAVIVKNIGRKVKVSQMELVCLCNFAKLGLLSVFCELDDEEGYIAAEETDKLIQAIAEQFSNSKADGLTRLAQSCVAILGEGRLGKYVLETE